MGCNLSSCTLGSKLTEEKKSEFDPNHSLTNVSKSLTNRSTDINTTSNASETLIRIKKLNLSNLTQLQSDRSFTSRIQNTTNSELRDKVNMVLNTRNGKSFLSLLKEINFSFKIIQKLDKIYSSFILPQNLNSSYQSEISKDEFSLKKAKNISNNDLIKSHIKKKNEIIENFTHFKSLFYIPLISLSGEIENYFELKKEKQKSLIHYVCFSFYFDYYETFFPYIVNLFQNFKYNLSYKDEFLKISTFSNEIQKIKISFFPKENITTISFFYVSEEFYSFFFSEDQLISSTKSIDKECISFNFSQIKWTHQYELYYKNINLSNKDFLVHLSNFLCQKAKNIKLLNQYKLVTDNYMRNCGFVVSFGILYSSDIRCVGYKIKIKTNHDWLVGEQNNVNSSCSSDDAEKKTSLRINSKFAQVKFLIINVDENNINISYEYAYLA